MEKKRMTVEIDYFLKCHLAGHGMRRRSTRTMEGEFETGKKRRGRGGGIGNF